MVASMLLSACGTTATPVATAAPATAAPATAAPATAAPATAAPATAAPAPTGPKSKDPTTLTLADSDVSIDTLDPALAYDTASGEIIQNTYDTLIFYDGSKLSSFVPLLADKWSVSADGKVYTFNIHPGVKFHNGDVMTPDDVAFTFQRGLLQAGSASPQWLLSEPFFGVGNQDVTTVLDPSGALGDDRTALSKVDPAKLKAVCDTVQKAIVADDTAGTVTMTLAQSWGPFLATVAQSWVPSWIKSGLPPIRVGTAPALPGRISMEWYLQMIPSPPLKMAQAPLSSRASSRVSNTPWTLSRVTSRARPSCSMSLPRLLANGVPASL